MSHKKFEKKIYFFTRHFIVTYEGLDVLQDKVAGDVARQVLAKLSDEFGVTLIFLP